MVDVDRSRASATPAVLPIVLPSDLLAERLSLGGGIAPDPHWLSSRRRSLSSPHRLLDAVCRAPAWAVAGSARVRRSRARQRPPALLGVSIGNRLGLIPEPRSRSASLAATAAVRSASSTTACETRHRRRRVAERVGRLGREGAGAGLVVEERADRRQRVVEEPQERLVDHRDRQLGRDRPAELVDGGDLELDRLARADDRLGRRDRDAQVALDLDVELGLVEFVLATSAWR